MTLNDEANAALAELRAAKTLEELNAVAKSQADLCERLLAADARVRYLHMQNLYNLRKALMMEAEDADHI